MCNCNACGDAPQSDSFYDFTARVVALTDTLITFQGPIGRKRSYPSNYFPGVIVGDEELFTADSFDSYLENWKYL